MGIPPDVDILCRLLDLSWRGIKLPCTTNEISFQHRLVEHKQYGVAGAYIENTGRDAAQFSFHIPFHVTMGEFPDLYPTRFRQFLNAFLDPSMGKLVHPELGELDARPHHFTLHADPNRRSGYDVDATWVETNESAGGLENAPGNSIQEAVTLSQQMDTYTKSVTIPADEYGDSGLSLTELLKSIAGAIQQSVMSVESVLAQVENAIDSVNVLLDAATLSHGKWALDVMSYLKGIESALNATRDELPSVKQIKRIALRISPMLEQVASSAARYGMSLEDFIALNPRYAANGRVPAGADVWIYQAA